MEIKHMNIAATLVSLLTPFLPRLLRLGGSIAEEAGKNIGQNLGDSAWEKAKQVWGKIAPRIGEKPLAKGAVEALAEDSEDGDAQDVLTKQLERILEVNPALMQSLKVILVNQEESASKVSNVTQDVVGDKNIVIGEANGSVNIS